MRKIAALLLIALALAGCGPVNAPRCEIFTPLAPTSDDMAALKRLCPQGFDVTVNSYSSYQPPSWKAE